MGTVRGLGSVRPEVGEDAELSEHWIEAYARRLAGRAFGSERPEPSS